MWNDGHSSVKMRLKETAKYKFYAYFDLNEIGNGYYLPCNFCIHWPIQGFRLLKTITTSLSQGIKLNSDK